MGRHANRALVAPDDMPVDFTVVCDADAEA